MFDLFFSFLHGIVYQYSLIGLFISSFLISTIFFPFSVELTFPILIRAGVHKIPILFVATFGSVAGTMVNYYIGYKGVALLRNYIRKDEVDKATKLMNRYGWFGVLAIVATPFLSADPLTILCGATKMNFKEFSVVVFFGKLIKYAIVLGVIEVIIRVF